jgi:hypothetical protein
MSRNARILAGVFIVGAVALGAFMVAKRGSPGVGGSTDFAGIALDGPVANAERIFFRYNGVDGNYGKLAYVEPANPTAIHYVDNLVCEVVYVGHQHGICMTAQRGVVTTYTAQFFDARTFQISSEMVLKGIPSRTRVSADDKFGALTVFVTGHGYTSLDFSTQTLILDLKTGRSIADLETFEVTRDGQVIKAADFNFWGVTFAHDSNIFFATLSTDRKHFLIEGNVAERKARVVHENVECPSLSPDGRKVAYKRRLMNEGRVGWQLQVLDLASMQDTPIAERRSIDDQLEWLDANTVLYSVPETANDETPSTEVWMAGLDPSRAPQRLLQKAYSPAVVRAASPVRVTAYGETNTTSTQ